MRMEKAHQLPIQFGRICSRSGFQNALYVCFAVPVLPTEGSDAALAPINSNLELLLGIYAMLIVLARLGDAQRRLDSGPLQARCRT